MNSNALMAYFIGFFQFFSLMPPVFGGQDQKSTWFNRTIIQFYLWAFVHFLFILIECSLIYSYFGVTFHTSSSIGALLDMLQVFAPIFNHFVMLLECVCKPKENHQMWQLMSEIDSISSALNIQGYRFVSAIIRNGIVTLLFGIISEFAVVMAIYRDFEAFARSWYFRIWSLNVVRIGLLELILNLEWIANQLDVISVELSEIVARRKKTIDLCLLKELHAKVWLFAVYFNDRFNWSIFMLLINLFVCITVGLYWVITRVYFNRWDLMFRKLFLKYNLFIVIHYKCFFFVAIYTEALLIVLSPMLSLSQLSHSGQKCNRKVSECAHRCLNKNHINTKLHKTRFS